MSRCTWYYMVINFSPDPMGIPTKPRNVQHLRLQRWRLRSFQCSAARTAAPRRRPPIGSFQVQLTQMLDGWPQLGWWSRSWWKPGKRLENLK